MLKKRAARKNFGKRRATRVSPWSASNGQPVVRLGALVFRLGQIRKSHNGLAPIRSDQDPDSRLCHRFYFLAAIGRRNVFFSFSCFLNANHPTPLMGQIEADQWKGFSRHGESSETNLSKKKGKAKRPSRLETNVSSPSSRLSLGRLLLSRACVCFTGHNKGEPRRQNQQQSLIERLKTN